jgi:hypothetical protein
LEKLRDMRTDNAADIRLNAMLENCIFYIFRMYEFSHSLDPKQTFIIRILRLVFKNAQNFIVSNFRSKIPVLVHR